MKLQACLRAAAALAIIGVVNAESEFEQDLKLLTEDRDDQEVKAIAKIDKDYRDKLQQLLKNATQAGELDAALKIREALEKLPGSVLIDRPTPNSAKDLKKFLDGTTWTIRNTDPDSDVLYTLTFSKNGTFKHSDGRTGKLQFLGPRKFRMWDYDPAELNDECNQFRAVGAAAVYFGRLKL